MTTTTKRIEQPGSGASTRTYFYVFVAALAVLGVSSWLAIDRDRVVGIEHQWLLAVNGLPVRLSGFMKAITLLGSLWAAAISVAGAYVAGMYRLAWRLALTTLTTYALVVFMKNMIERPRPIGPLDDLYVRATESSFAFPSGHAAIVTAIMITLLAYTPKKWWWIVLLPIVLVALSRLYLGVHAPLDIIGGVTLGVGVVVGFRILPLPLRHWLRID